MAKGNELNSINVHTNKDIPCRRKIRIDQSIEKGSCFMEPDSIDIPAWEDNFQ